MPWLIAVGGTLTTGQAELVDELAGLAGVTRARAERPAEVTGDVRVVALRTEGSEESQDVLEELGARILESAGDTTYAVTTGLDVSALSTVEPLLRARRILCGVSDPVPAGELAGARELARYALAEAATRQGKVAVVPGGQVPVHRLLLAGAPAELRAAVRRRVLGPLLDYDAEQHTDLVHTVRVFLECSGAARPCQHPALPHRAGRRAARRGPHGVHRPARRLPRVAGRGGACMMCLMRRCAWNR